MTLPHARARAWRLRAEFPSWKKAAASVGMTTHTLYDLATRPHKMTKKRRDAAMEQLGFEVSTPVYWRPCLSLSTKEEVADMLESNPGYTLTDIIHCGMRYFENEHE